MKGSWWQDEQHFQQVRVSTQKHSFGNCWDGAFHSTDALNVTQSAASKHWFIKSHVTGGLWLSYWAWDNVMPQSVCMSHLCVHCSTTLIDLLAFNCQTWSLFVKHKLQFVCSVVGWSISTNSFDLFGDLYWDRLNTLHFSYQWVWVFITIVAWHLSKFCSSMCISYCKVITTLLLACW